LPDILSGAEITQLLDAVRSVKHRAILTTAYGAGLRIGEVCTLQVADLPGRRGLAAPISRGAAPLGAGLPHAEGVPRAVSGLSCTETRGMLQHVRRTPSPLDRLGTPAGQRLG